MTAEEKAKLAEFVEKLTKEERSALRNLIVLRDIEDYFLNGERKDV